MPKTFTPSKKDIIKLNLIKKGREFFIKYGLKKTSIDDLVRAVGIAKGSFYKFFESKESLFLAIHEASEAKLRTELLSKVEKIKNPKERLRIFLKSSFAILEQDPLMHAVFCGGEPEGFSGFIYSKEYEYHYRENIAFMKDLIKRWQEERIIRQVDAEVAGNLIASAFFIYLQKETLGKETYAKVIDMLVECLVNYLSEAK